MFYFYMASENGKKLYLFYSLLCQECHLQWVGLYCLPWQVLILGKSHLLCRNCWTIGLGAMILKMNQAWRCLHENKQFCKLAGKNFWNIEQISSGPLKLLKLLTNLMQTNSTTQFIWMSMQHIDFFFWINKT